MAEVDDRTGDSDEVGDGTKFIDHRLQFWYTCTPELELRIMSKQTAVRLPDEIHSRLQALAARTGRTATYYIREAIEEHLDDLEDLYLAERVSKRLKDGKSKSRTLDEVERELGLDD